MNLEGYLTLLVKLAAMAAIASVVARSNHFQAMVMRETRTLTQRAVLALWLGAIFGVSVSCGGSPDSRRTRQRMKRPTSGSKAA